jgi:hypothetical protein
MFPKDPHFAVSANLEIFIFLLVTRSQNRGFLEHLEQNDRMIESVTFRLHMVGRALNQKQHLFQMFQKSAISQVVTALFAKVTLVTTNILSARRWNLRSKSIVVQRRLAGLQIRSHLRRINHLPTSVAPTGELGWVL